MRSAIILAALCLTVVDGVHAQNARRRRRGKPSSAPNPGSCGLVTKLMSEMVDLRAELKTLKKGAEKVMEMESHIRSLKEEVETLKKSKGPTNGLPFQVEGASKTVKLVGWNLHIMADDPDRRGEPRMEKCKQGKDCGTGNLIVGTGHRYQEAVESVFSGYGHSAYGYGHGFLGGAGNVAGGVGSTYNGFGGTALAGGSNNRANGRYDFVGGGRGSVVGSHGYCTTAVGGWKNIVNSSYSVVVGGMENIANMSMVSVIVGGTKNNVQPEAAVVVGGREISIGLQGGSGVAIGGYNNSLNGNGYILGGVHNMIHSHTGFQNGIVGGLGNVVKGYHIGRGNLVLGGEKNNVTSRKDSREPLSYEIIPLTWKPGTLKPGSGPIPLE